ncbi:MAG: peptidoglycan-binding protein [Oscillospiraceae bacterium]|jgi:hypothetical protein|nr:peptidoglycan-binding protein [Oscillospiraceae bacterium]
MEQKTNTGIAEWAKKARDEKWGYVWGTFGQLLTAQLLADKVKQYPTDVGGKLSTIKEKGWVGRRCVDCVGLIKGYLWAENDVIKYNTSTDYYVGSLFDKCTEKGTYQTRPEIIGLAVFKNRTHVGIYIGNGKVIEAKGTAYGVIESNWAGGGWTHWGKIPGVSYDNSANKPTIAPKPAENKTNTQPAATVKTPTTVKKGSKGATVRQLQTLLNKNGAKLAVDGDFGTKTLAAVKAYQKAKGLVVDGVVGVKTWGVLLK